MASSDEDDYGNLHDHRSDSDSEDNDDDEENDPVTQTVSQPTIVQPWHGMATTQNQTAGTTLTTTGNLTIHGTTTTGTLTITGGMAPTGGVGVPGFLKVPSVPHPKPDVSIVFPDGFKLTCAPMGEEVEAGIPEDYVFKPEEKSISIQEVVYLRKRVTDLEEAMESLQGIVESLWYAPGAPGYMNAERKFQKHRLVAEESSDVKPLCGNAIEVLFK